MQPVDGETLEAVSGGKSPIVCPPDPQKSHRDRVLSQFYGYNGNWLYCLGSLDVPVWVTGTGSRAM